MISIDEVKRLILSEFENAEVEVIDRTGQSDHFIVRVISNRFEGVGLMDRHRMVYAALNPAMKDGRIHAVEIKADVPA
jgi:acid stress-induced BolA-like protein IbaG/YrbA